MPKPILIEMLILVEILVIPGPIASPRHRRGHLDRSFDDAAAGI